MKIINIRARILLLVFIILIPLAILQGCRIASTYKDKVDAELYGNMQLAEAISKAFVNCVEELWAQEAMIGVHIADYFNMSPDQWEKMLKSYKESSELASAWLWIDQEGTVSYSTNPSFKGVSLKDRAYIKRLINGEEKVVSDLIMSHPIKQQIITVGRTIYRDKNPLGFLVAVVDIQKLSERLPYEKIRPGTRFGLVDKNGRMVFVRDKSNIPYEQRMISENAPTWKALNGEHVFTRKRSSPLDKTDRMGANYPIKSIGWACFVTTSYASILEKHNAEILEDILALAIILVISVFSAGMIAYKIVTPINNLKKAAHSIIAGNLSARTNIAGFDEIALTAQTFDYMVDTIEQYDTLKTQFFSNLSHELKTPLNVIFGTIQLLEGAREQDFAAYRDKVNRNLKVAKQNCYRLLRLISNIIDLTKLDGGFLNLKPDNHNIVEIVEAITLSIVPYAETKKITIVFDTEVEEKQMSCDPDAIERIILNLMSNAIKFTNPEGFIYVNIADKGFTVTVSVSDTGIGIPEDKLHVVFDRFRQVDNSLSRQNEGSGIGLSLVKALVEAHKGSISVTSKPDEGTTFKMEFPAEFLDKEIEHYKGDRGDFAQSLVERINIEFSDIYF